MEKRQNREILKVLFASGGDIKVTAAILGVPEGVVRRYLRRRDTCRSEEHKIRPAHSIPPPRTSAGRW